MSASLPPRIAEVSERCACGASLRLTYDDTDNYARLLRYLTRWRSSHRHEEAKTRTRAIGFPLPEVYPDDNDDGDN